MFAHEVQVMPPEYSPDLFVNREEAIKLVVDKARSISGGAPVRKRIIVFEGYRGSGKSWLLQHLAREILPALGSALAAYVDLQRHKGETPQTAIPHIIAEIGTALGLGARGHDKSPETLPLIPAADWLIKEVRARSDKVLVLLLDSVYEARQEILEPLEEYVLGPLVVIPHVVIVMAGRGQAYPWLTPQLRFGAEHYDLPPFSEVDTREQLQRQRPGVASHADGIHKATHGYPLANVVIPYPLDKATRQEMQAMIDLLLEPIRKPDGTWPPEREYLQALSILRTFDEERIPILLDAYRNSRVISNFAPYYTGAAPDWTLAQANQILRRLIATKLVGWNSDAGGGWTVDRAIRELLEEYLRVVDNARWRCCHETAIRLYQDWGSRYPETKAVWDAEVEYHKGRLQAGDALSVAKSMQQDGNANY